MPELNHEAVGHAVQDKLDEEGLTKKNLEDEGVIKRRTLERMTKGIPVSKASRRAVSERFWGQPNYLERLGRGLPVDEQSAPQDESLQRQVLETLQEILRHVSRDT